MEDRGRYVCVLACSRGRAPPLSTRHACVFAFSCVSAIAEANCEDMAARETTEKAAQRERELEQRAIRERQIAEVRARRELEAAEHRAYESYQMKLSLEADEAKRLEAAKELEEKRALVKRQVRASASRLPS